jgi:hypothetical protein
MFDWLRRTPPPPTEQQRQMAQALAEYPPYAPPEWNPDTKSLRDANEEYREYFFGSRQSRLEALRAFLEGFDVVLNLDDAGIMAVSAWLPSTEICLCLIWTTTLSGMHIGASQLPGQERWVVSIPYSTLVSTMPNVFGREERN